MNMKKFLVSMVAIIATACSTCFAQIAISQSTPKTPAEQEMINLSRNKWQWMAEKNADKLAELFHDEVQFVHMGGYWGKTQELNTIRSGGIWYKNADIHSEEVKFTENTAVVYSRIHLDAVVGGNEVRNPFIVSEVYVKENGKWLLSVLAFTKTMGK